MGKKHKLKRADNETRRKILARIKFGKVNKCKYFKKFHCMLKNMECDPSSPNCHFEFNSNYNKSISDTVVRVSAVVLSHNRKCTYENHKQIDLKAHHQNVWNKKLV